MSSHVLKLRPATLDAACEGKTNPAARLWQLARISLLDRAVYWGIAITAILPAALGGFDFHGGFGAALAVSGAFWLYEVIASLLIGVVTLGLFGRERKKLVTRLQQAGFMATAGLFLWGLGAYFPGLFSVSLVGILVGVVVLALLAEWALPAGGCSGGACELPKK